ncbi:FAD-dependent oxidoreductase domain-containing protein 1-like [Mya arenaria]|uniref:FAD-dependent oxidoreductase domain-containing protein 1-like n=1 Tax=Mya arenaria TaxID=6604 RepID=UPI0022E45E49|nr:FAD-dependent oxidoreductase domain-containing protein 1-like [Mya arenaria]XP_052789915.1 FAD-dependent oxidoreductase domain-containing protein 1-like [Mya arenaria]
MMLNMTYRSLVLGQNSRVLQQCGRFFSDKVPANKKEGKVEKEEVKEREYVGPGSEPRSALKVLKNEFEPMFFGKGEKQDATVPRRTDFLIIGGGLTGTAVAFFLKQHADMYDVTIVERDYCYTRASSMLSAGGLRHQFTIPENVQMSMYTTEFLKTYKTLLGVKNQDTPCVDFHPHGYLFLAPEDRAQFLLECVQMQREQGAKTVILGKSELAEKFPWINLDGVECGSYGTEGEGWFDPWQLVQAMKAKNIELGVRYCEGDVVKFRYEDVQTTEGAGFRMSKQPIGVDVEHPNGKTYGCDASVMVNAAGPWAGEIARMVGIGDPELTDDIVLPVEPRKRFVYTVHCPEGPTLDCPFLIDTSGAYFRREGLGGHYICGASPSEDQEPSIADLSVDYDFYQNVVWPSIAHRVPAFNNSKLKSAWAGFYDYNTVDQNLIIGPHPKFRNFLFANGMSGHGVQQGLAIGRALFELAFYSEYKTIDLSMFDFGRFKEKRPVLEEAIV